MLQQKHPYPHTQRPGKPVTFPVLLLFIVGLLTALTACSPAQGGQTQNCGTVHTLGGHFIENAAAVSQAENCFWHAFQQCSPATLTYETSGIDAGTIHTFTTVNNNGNCSISDATQHYIAPNPTQPGDAYTCSSLSQQADGLHFSGCGGEGNVLVPASVEQACGQVRMSLNGLLDVASAQQAESCFWKAFHTCQPASLIFRQMGVDTVLTRTFVLHHGACTISDTVQNGGPDAVPVPPHTYTCTGLTQQADGLHFSGCGDDGTILVPSQKHSYRA